MLILDGILNASLLFVVQNHHLITPLKEVAIVSFYGKTLGLNTNDFFHTRLTARLCFGFVIISLESDYLYFLFDV